MIEHVNLSNPFLVFVFPGSRWCKLKFNSITHSNWHDVARLLFNQKQNIVETKTASVANGPGWTRNTIDVCVKRIHGPTIPYAITRILFSVV